MTALHTVSSLLFPWLVTTSVLLAARRRVRPTSTIAAVVCAATSLGLMLVPVQGWPVHRWPSAINVQASVPLLAWLGHHVWHTATGRELLRARDVRGLTLVAACAGIALYPSALGLGDVDAYELGWGAFALPAVVATTAVALALAGNRACWVFVAALLAWYARCFESTNLWDYLVDPLVALAAVTETLVRWSSPSRWVARGRRGPRPRGEAPPPAAAARR